MGVEGWGRDVCGAGVECAPSPLPLYCTVTDTRAANSFRRMPGNMSSSSSQSRPSPPPCIAP